MIIEIYQTLPANPVIEQARALYAEAFAEPPYLEGPDQAEEFVARLSRYSAQRSGFRLLLARRGPRLAGLALTVLGEPGDRWRDQAAEHLGRRRARVAGRPGHRGGALAVDPLERRRRVGTALLARVGGERAVLSCHPKATAAQQLYLGTGWRQLSDSFQLAGADQPCWLMGRRTTGKPKG